MINSAAEYYYDILFDIDQAMDDRKLSREKHRLLMEIY
jgi:hypothetical protein